MVGWYDPTQLLNTGKKTVISTAIGENADPRLVTAAATGGKFFDYSKELNFNKHEEFKDSGEARKEIWIDYVSDVGDGWNSTYSVAYSLARPEIDGKKRGEILIFGGDEVYPTATDEEYRNRLVQPYEMAFNASRNGETAEIVDGERADLTKLPHVFALPGNHDWYDSLVAFQKIFCTHILNERKFAGGWRTRQKRGYFSLKLPHNWWLLGVDLQLSHNIDTRQLQYFETIVEKMDAGDKVIICVPEPYWVKAIKYEEFEEAHAKFKQKEKSLEKLESLLEKKGVEVKLYLAGDLHHYRRFESEDGRRTQKITAGGGGAFLHPTHDFDFKSKMKTAKSFTLENEYPTSEVSSRQDWKNLFGFLWNNKTFGILTAVLYALLAFLIHGNVEGNFTWRKAVTATVNRCINEPLALIVVILMVIGLVFFTDSNSKFYRRVAGTIHGLTHLTAVFFLGWVGFLLMQYFIGADNFNSMAYQNNNLAKINLVWLGCIVLVCGAGGYVFGSLIMGIYLFVSLHIFGRHDNEAFSALKIQDYKNFVRLHIGEDGKLTIYPFKIEKVSRDWDDDDEKKTRHPRTELKPELIEKIEPLG